jgi:pimeloyl-ACP methyl ester carboxylesterase
MWPDAHTPSAAQSGPWPGQHAQLPGVRLWYVDTGGTGDVVVLLHANTGTVRTWDEQIATFHAAGLRVIAFDRRGWGRSEIDPSTGPQPGTVADDLDGLMQHLHVDSFHLVGIAGGGFVALDYAAWRPHKLRKLVVCASNGQFNEAEMQALSAHIAIPGLTGTPALRSFLEVGVAYRAENPEGWARFKAIEHQAQQAGAPAQPMRTPNTYAKVATIQTPTLVLMGGADLLAPPALMLTWARHLQNAELACIGDAGHAINWERPAAFNTVVLDFLAPATPANPTPPGDTHV